jgi:hypothetical protein
MLLVHCQVSAPAFSQRPFPFELEKSMRQQHLSAEDPILEESLARLRVKEMHLLLLDM